MSVDSYLVGYRVCPFVVEGTCNGVSAGAVDVKINAGACHGESTIGECYFGWISYLHISISETFIPREVIHV